MIPAAKVGTEMCMVATPLDPKSGIVQADYTSISVGANGYMMDGQLCAVNGILRRQGCASAALRYPAPLTVRPLRPVVAFAACGSPCTRPARRVRRAGPTRLPASGRCYIHVAIGAR